MLTTSASSLQSRMKARRTEMTCTAMNSLFRTRTLASSGEFELAIMKPPGEGARPTGLSQPGPAVSAQEDALAWERVRVCAILARPDGDLQALAGRPSPEIRRKPLDERPRAVKGRLFSWPASQARLGWITRKRRPTVRHVVNRTRSCSSRDLETPP